MSDVWTMYHAFGVVSAVKGAKIDVTSKQLDEAFPEAELTDGIAHIVMESHGDVPGEIFLSVHAISTEKAVDMWNHVARSAVMTVASWWTETTQ